MTTDKAMQRVAAKLDAALAEGRENAAASFLDSGLTDEEIEELVSRSDEETKIVRAQMLAEIRRWFERGCRDLH